MNLFYYEPFSFYYYYYYHFCSLRLSGLTGRSPARWVLTGKPALDGWHALPSPEAICETGDVQYLLVEGGALTAASFLSAGLVDKLLLYRAPIIIGGGMPSIGDIGLTSLAAAHGQWRLDESRHLGSDILEVYSRKPCSPE